MKVEKFEEITGTGRFFHITFIKADGSKREMNCRTGVAKHVKGTGKPIDKSNGRVGVWELSKDHTGADAYRSLYTDKIVQVKANGKVYDGDGNVVDE